MLVDVDGDDFAGCRKSRSELERLRLGSFRQLGSADPRRKTEVVLDAGSRCGLSAGSNRIEHSCGEPFRGGVDRCRQSRRARSDDSTEQTLYFDDDGLLARHDYDVEISGGTSAAHYVSEYAEVAGIRLPTRHRIFPRTPDSQSLAEPLVVSIDLSEIAFT